MVDLNVVLLPKQHRCAYWYMGAFRNRSTYLIWVLINKNQMLGGKGGGHYQRGGTYWNEGTNRIIMVPI